MTLQHLHPTSQPCTVLCRQTLETICPDMTTRMLAEGYKSISRWWWWSMSTTSSDVRDVFS